MNPRTDAPRRKPHVALGIATGLGLGYLPIAPGTWGSLLGVFLTLLTFALLIPVMNVWDIRAMSVITYTVSSKAFLLFAGGLAIVISLLGLWAADRVAAHLQRKDPSIVVVDEVAGQLITYLGLASASTFALNWQYLLAGFILFRVFDIWKPFPARQAEALPGGLGIMADDWIAGVYAALVLGLARLLGL